MRIAWRAYGDRDRPNVALLHSLGLDATMWDEQVVALERDYRVITMDTRGHGRSDAPTGAYSLEELADDVLSVAAAAGAERFHVVGLSLGGLMALWLAAHHGPRIGSVVLADTAARIGLPTRWQERIEQVRRGGMASIGDAVLGIWFTPRFAKENPVRHAWARERLLTTPAAGYMGCCAALAASDLREVTASVAAPALVLVGEADVVTPPADAARLARAITGAELVILPRAAHIANLEAASAFTDRVSRFLARQAG